MRSRWRSAENANGQPGSVKCRMRTGVPFPSMAPRLARRASAAPADGGAAERDAALHGLRLPPPPQVEAQHLADVAGRRDAEVQALAGAKAPLVDVERLDDVDRAAHGREDPRAADGAAPARAAQLGGRAGGGEAPPPPPPS